MSPEKINGQNNFQLIKDISRKLLEFSSKDIQLTGLENIPPKGPAIVVANHMGILEALVPYIFLQETPVIFTKKENLQIPILGGLLKDLGSISVNREILDSNALNAANEVLVKQNKIIFTCPEGTRGRDENGDRIKLKKAKGGVILIAQRAANELGRPIPISPWAIWGTEGVLPVIDEPGPLDKRLAFHRDNVYINIGPPYLIHPHQKLSKEYLQNTIDSLMISIRDLLPVKYHGYYAR